MKKTALIILNYNNVDDSVTCIDSVERFNTAPVKYILVDNASTKEGVVDSLHEAMSKRFGDDYICLTDGEKAPTCLPKFTFLTSSLNNGYAAGNNKGLKLVYDDDEIEYVMILNPDILFVEDIIPKLISQKEQIDDCGIISPMLYKKGLKDIDVTCARKRISKARIITDNFFKPIRWTIKCDSDPFSQYLLNGVDEKSFPVILPITLPSGSCMLMEKNVMKEIGSFDEGTFLYFEENILANKLERIGMRSYLMCKLKCIHLGASTIGLSPSTKVMRAGIKSQKYYFMNFSGANIFEKALYQLSYWWMMGYIGLKKLIKRK